jgi:hypothetical protein
MPGDGERGKEEGRKREGRKRERREREGRGRGKGKEEGRKRINLEHYQQLCNSSINIHNNDNINISKNIIGSWIFDSIPESAAARIDFPDPHTETVDKG